MAVRQPSAQRYPNFAGPFPAAAAEIVYVLVIMGNDCRGRAGAAGLVGCPRGGNGAAYRWTRPVPYAPKLVRAAQPFRPGARPGKASPAPGDTERGL